MRRFRLNVLSASMLCLLASCTGSTPVLTPTPSPEEAYAASMAGLLPTIEWWSEARTGINEILGILPLDYLLFGPAVWEAGLEQDPDLKEVIGEFIPALSGYADKSFELKAQLGAIQPPPSAATYHNELVKCVDYEEERARALAELLATGVDNSVFGPQGCDNLAASIEGIRSIASSEGD